MPHQDGGTEWECPECGVDVMFDAHLGWCGDGKIKAMEEVRVKDPISGGEKGQKKARFHLIPSEFLWALAEHYGIGAVKYTPRNWERGYAWSLTVDAMERHWTQFKLGERVDPETGSHHLVAAAWHVIALFIFDVRGIGTDDIHVRTGEKL